jgi:hypothetical protein
MEVLHFVCASPPRVEREVYLERRWRARVLISEDMVARLLAALLCVTACVRASSSSSSSKVEVRCRCCCQRAAPAAAATSAEVSVAVVWL